MSKTTWADVEREDLVELHGKTYKVTSIAKATKKARVEVKLNGAKYESTVKLSDRVKIVTAPVQDAAGTQRRWATKRELDAVTPARLASGDSAQTKPPRKAKGGSWEKPESKAEAAIVDLLQARLVGETNDESAGYYVPPVDVTTVAAHLLLFHGFTPPADESEGSMLEWHTRQHANAEPLEVNHWHTAKRPSFS